MPIKAAVEIEPFGKIKFHSLSLNFSYLGKHTTVDPKTEGCDPEEGSRFMLIQFFYVLAATFKEEGASKQLVWDVWEAASFIKH